jgi:hypothetical protein
VHGMVFGRRGPGDLLSPFYGGRFILTLPDAPDDVRSAWDAAAQEFGASFGITYEISSFFQYDANEMEVLFGADRGCAPSPVLGFCRVNPGGYMIFAVAPDRARDPLTMRRVIASLFLGFNPLVGLLNPNTPAETLSQFEIRTIRLILLKFQNTRWPDNDRP